MKHKYIYLVLSMLLVFLCKTKADIRLPKLVSNGMILQRNTNVTIWGFASPRENIRITFLNKTYRTIADTNGKWQLNLDPLSAGGPYNMTIKGNNSIQLSNILIGDVWVCSGQSNMEFLMERVKDKYAYIIANANNNYIRQFWVKPYANFQGTQEDVDAKSIGWTAADPQTVLHFTAVGYFFAKELYDKYKIPVGIINSSLGGTPVESWLSSDALKQFPDLDSIYQKYDDTAFTNSLQRKENQLVRKWNRMLLSEDKGLHEIPKWYEKNYQPDGWRNIEIPDYYIDMKRSDSSGVFWYRKEIILPASIKNKTAIIRLGNIDVSDSTYINGINVGYTLSRYTPRIYTIPSGLLTEGKNIITVRVVKTKNAGGFIIDKPYQLEIGKDVYPLSGEWQYKVGVRLPKSPSTTAVSHGPGGLYNAMIAPLINYKIKGILWYQGEGNTSNPKPYYKWFTALIKDWRAKWKNDSLPFLYVQISAYGHPGIEPVESNWAQVREAQLKTLQLPNTGMAVTTDIGEWNDVHPLNKWDVGKRLFLAAEKTAYHKNTIVFSGPIYHSMHISGDSIIIDFINIGSGLISKDADTLKQFAIAGTDGKYIWAHAFIKEHKVYVWNENISHPASVRYAWANTPLGSNLFNKEGLPASPFSTDKKDDPSL